jgi:hypothetical protein
LGNYDEVIQHVVQSTDHKVTYKMFYDNELNIEGRHNYEKSKRYRMATHLMSLDNYDLAIYLDGNVKIIHSNFINEIANNFLDEQWDFLMTKHEKHKNANEEIAECYHSKKYSKIGLEFQYSIINSLKQSDQQLCWCGFNVQWLKSPNRKKVIDCFELWWKYLCLDPYGICNDQIYFPYVKDHFDFTMKYFEPEYLQNHYFYIFTHKKI